MPIQYIRDDANRRIRVTTIGPIRLDEIIGTVDRQANERTWSFTALAEAERWLDTLSTTRRARA